MIIVQINNKNIEIKKGTRLEDLVRYSRTEHLICGAYVNNIIKSLKYELNESMTKVEFIDITNEAGMRIYVSTLFLLFSRAAYMAFPYKKISINYSLGGGIFCQFTDGSVMEENDVRKIKRHMQKMIKEGYPILKHKIPWRDAYVFMREHKISSTTDPELLLYLHAQNVSLYEIDGFYGYFYSKVLSETSDVYLFDLIKYKPGCVILIPDRNDPNKIREFERQVKLHREFQEYEDWCMRLGVSDVVSLNKKIEDHNSITQLITVAEARHEQHIAEMAEQIYKERDSKRVILIAGPSSAGKTTTSKRLRTHLIARDLQPIAISLDNYFVDRKITPKDENGEYDFESIHAIDIEKFNHDLLKLMAGEEAEVPLFDFQEGKRLPVGQKLKVDPDSPIIIEGIHGLNEKLTEHIPKKNKYKIYVNDLTHLNIDQNNRIPTSDVRLLRRIVRDNTQRGHNALATISMWQSVKRGEERNIYPYSKEADFVFNSSLLYELAVLKKYAEPVLAQVSPDNIYYAEAKRLLDFLSFFRPIEDESAIYTNSILREFIGGNVFDEL